jgi:hypothetical protein
VSAHLRQNGDLKGRNESEMNSSQQKLEFPFDPEEEYELILGESFLSSRPNTGFHTIRCKTYFLRI